MDLALPTGCHGSFLGLGACHDIPAIDPACLATGFWGGQAIRDFWRVEKVALSSLGA